MKIIRRIYEEKYRAKYKEGKLSKNKISELIWTDLNQYNMKEKPSIKTIRRHYLDEIVGKVGRKMVTK